MVDSLSSSESSRHGRLFTPADDWWHNACLSFLPGDWLRYVQGYKLAADALIGHAVEACQHQDLLVFPIVFLYRQYLELSIKIVIRGSSNCLEQPDDFPKSHDLETLWTKCKVLLEQIEPIPESDIYAVESVIAEFAQADPSSQGFRYPTAKDGSPSLPSSLAYINLRNLRDVMDRLTAFFEAVFCVIQVHLECKSEISSAYRNAYGVPSDYDIGS